MTAIIGLLTTKQRLFARQTSKVIVQESSDLLSNNSLSSDKEKDDLVSKVDLERSIKRLLRSRDITDQRFIDLYRIS